MKTYRIQYQKTDYSFASVIVEAENKREAVKKFPNPQDSIITNITGHQRQFLLANTTEITGDSWKKNFNKLP